MIASLNLATPAALEAVIHSKVPRVRILSSECDTNEEPRNPRVCEDRGLDPHNCFCPCVHFVSDYPKSPKRTEPEKNSNPWHGLSLTPRSRVKEAVLAEGQEVRLSQVLGQLLPVEALLLKLLQVGDPD